MTLTQDPVGQARQFTNAYALPDPGAITGGFIFNSLLGAAAGYAVGRHTKSALATAAATAIFGLPGMFVATLFAPGGRKR